MQLAPQDVYPLGGSAPPFAIVDVRSPVEVARGALPGARSLPLMTDEERHLVGIRYKEAGQRAAIDLGYELVGADLAARVAAWRGAVDASPLPTAVTCWRGGLRSALVVELAERQRAAPVAGGYKALRAHLARALPAALARKRIVVLAGLTGTGKTRLLRALTVGSGASTAAVPAAPPACAAGPAAPPAGAGTAATRPSRAAAPGGVGPAAARGLQVLDLEGLACHRGSAFGDTGAPQPSQQTFENAVAAALVLDPATRLVVEDESRFVGARSVPEPLHAAMLAAPIVVLEASGAERSRAIHAEYVAEPTARLGREVVAANLAAACTRLKSRLGAAATEALVREIVALAGEGPAWADADAHAGWIGALLERHYDPLYRRSLGKLARPVAFAGDEEAVSEWLTTLW